VALTGSVPIKMVRRTPASRMAVIRWRPSLIHAPSGVVDDHDAAGHVQQGNEALQVGSGQTGGGGGGQGGSSIRGKTAGRVATSRVS
jgi:hypothetical protein